MTNAVVVPWHRREQLEKFLEAWEVMSTPDWLVLQHDAHREGSGATKNKGIAHAMRKGAEIVIVLDDDCFPTSEANTLSQLVEKHVKALEPRPVRMFDTVTEPPSRGTPSSSSALRRSCRRPQARP